MAVDVAVERVDLLRERPGREAFEGFAVDLHAAVDEVDEGEQIGFRAPRFHGRAELRLPVMAEDHVAEEHCLLLRHPEALRRASHRVRAHDEMPEQLAAR